MPDIERSIAQDVPPQRGSSSRTIELERLHAKALQLRRCREYGAAALMFVEIADLVPSDWLAQYNAGAVLFEAARLNDAIVYLDRSLGLHPNSTANTLCGHALALQGDMAAARTAYERAVGLAPQDVDANWGLFEVTQVLGDDDAALHHQRIALAKRTLRTIDARVQPPQTTILELCIAGTFQANIPLDFILDRDRITVHKLYVGEHAIPKLPAYDLVFNTIAEASNAGPALSAAQAFIAGQHRPALNDPRLVASTSREAIAARFADSSTVAVARTRPVDRAALRTLDESYPFLIRPLDSHAGNDLAKIDDPHALAAYLAATPDADEFYVSAFVDYRNEDGYYRKYRFVFIDGVSYPVHAAISPRWMIHYYNAPMAETAWMRDEEHAFMRDADAVFRGRAADGLREIAAALPLDYFGIDCSIAPDGRLLLFEASTAMLVHLRDPVDLYPYKAQYVPRIITALERLFDTRLGRGAPS
jgi:tetratricopeptide (TPR) repeat protein